MVGSYIMVLRALTLVPAAQAVMRSRIATQLPGATPQQLQERIAFHDFLSSQRTPVRIFGVGVDRYLLVSVNTLCQSTRRKVYADTHLVRRQRASTW